MPGGHPEGYIEGFANLYRGAAGLISARRAGQPFDPLAAASVPTVIDGAKGIRFVEAAVQSSRADGKWMSAATQGALKSCADREREKDGHAKSFAGMTTEGAARPVAPTRPAPRPSPRPGRRRRTASRGRSVPPVWPSWCAAVSARRAPDMPSGWPSAMAPPLGLTCSASSARPSWRSTARAWLAKASFSSIDVEIGDLRPSRSQQLLRRRDRADAHDARRHAGRGHAEDAGARRQPVALGRRCRGEEQRRGAVIDARGIAGGDRAAGLRTIGFSLASASSVVSARGCSSRLDDDRAALAAGDFDRHDLLGAEAAGSLRRDGALLASAARRRPGRRGETWNSSATFSPVSGMESTPYCCLHQRVDEAPADGGVVDLGACAEKAVLGLAP